MVCDSSTTDTTMSEETVIFYNMNYFIIISRYLIIYWIDVVHIYQCMMPRNYASINYFTDLFVKKKSSG